MHDRTVYSVGLGVLLLLSATAFAGEVKKSPWQRINHGLELGIFTAKTKARLGDSKIRVLRIDPKYYSFHLVNASAPGEGSNMSVRQWARRYKFVAAINASMYQRDHSTSISLMRSANHTNNPSLSKHKSILAFMGTRKDEGAVKLFDRECDNITGLKKRFRVLVQSIRMISCHGKNVWKKSDESWSTAMIAADKQGRLLFIHVRALYTTHDLINNLLLLPLDIRTAMYVEGGPQAQLYIRTPTKEYTFLGRYRSAITGKAIAKFGWPVPNVIGIRPR